MRCSSWDGILQSAIGDRKVVTEAEMIEAILQAGRVINPDVRLVLAHRMRGLGWRLRAAGGRRYVRKAGAR
jgi:hypothetical protein